jgi:hypothetical protein
MAGCPPIRCWLHVTAHPSEEGNQHLGKRHFNPNSEAGSAARRPASWSHTAGRPKAMGLPSEAFAQAGRRAMVRACILPCIYPLNERIEPRKTLRIRTLSKERNDGRRSRGRVVIGHITLRSDAELRSSSSHRNRSCRKGSRPTVFDKHGRGDAVCIRPKPHDRPTHSACESPA